MPGGPFLYFLTGILPPEAAAETAYHALHTSRRVRQSCVAEKHETVHENKK